MVVGRLLRAIMAVCVCWAVVFAGPSGAQTNDIVFVQIEAQPSLRGATDAASGYARRLPDVNGFALGGGWYAVTLGPYTRADADRVLRTYRNARQIPRDSFVIEAGRMRQQFWPIGSNVLNNLPVAQPPSATQQATAPAQPTEAPNETRAQAQRSESRLTRDEKKDLQIALQWAGFYQGAIDGAYGRGTRGAMTGWQTENGFEATGVLTTRQRAALLQQYNAVLDDLLPALITDARAGVAVVMPTAAVEFEKYDYPFAHYSGPNGAKVLLISQEGTQNTLFGLYDIMQTLEIVPFDGPRERRDRSFRLKGEDGRIVSETIARLESGRIKGFTLVWPAGDEEARTRLLAEMEKSFATTSSVLSPSDAQRASQSVDLVAGLSVRKPRLSRSGFFVDPQGAVITSTAAVESCTRVTIDDEMPADVIAVDGARGIAVLRPEDPLAPRAIAQFARSVPPLGSDVAVAGFSYEGVLGAPSATFGTLSDIKDLAGNPERKRLAVATLPGDVGGPVLDFAGGVLGMLLPEEATGRSLPEGVHFAANGVAITAALGGSGVTLRTTDTGGALDPVDLSAAARDMTVLVSCWD